ncbi:T9SS type A sorting domain-containing protein [Flavobacteriaceae bacterium]|nr:T9SS type A sorting domain-containing protein [Flavobacteriaceae bacterium]
MMNTTPLKTFILVFLTSFCLSGQDLTVESGGELYIESGKFIYLSDADIDGGSVTINSDATNSGTFLATGDVTVENDGKIEYNRYIPSTNWHLVTSPVTDQNVTSFASNSENSLATSGNKVAIAKYDNTKAVGSRWVYYDSSTPSEFDTNFGVGEGYTIKRTASGTISFEGAYPTVTSAGNVEKALETSSSHLWFTVGNPLPAYLPATRTGGENSLLSENSDILDSSYTALYFWTGSEWEAYNNLSDSYLPPGSSFMVRLSENQELRSAKGSFKGRSDDTVQETFLFPRAYQSHRTESENFNKAVSTKQHIELSIVQNNVVKKTRLYFHEQGTPKLDKGYDAASYEQSNETFGIHSRLMENDLGTDFSIQTLPSYDDQEFVIPLSIYANKGKVKVEATINNLPENMALYLEDRLEGTFHELHASSFRMNFDEKFNENGRFFLSNFPPEKPEDEVVQTKTIVPLDLFNIDSNSLKVVGVEADSSSRIEIYSFNGNKLYETTFYGNDTNEIELPSQIKTGIYVAVLTDEQGKRVIKKITIK